MKLKKLDYIIIASLILITILSSVVIFGLHRRKFDEQYVEIQVEGKFYKRVPLTNYNETLKIKSKLGTNIIRIANGIVSVSEADCPDKICIKDGSIRYPGQILVCLPNKVVVEIKGENIRELDDIAH